MIVQTLKVTGTNLKSQKGHPAVDYIGKWGMGLLRGTILSFQEPHLSPTPSPGRRPLRRGGGGGWGVSHSRALSWSQPQPVPAAESWTSRREAPKMK